VDARWLTALLDHLLATEPIDPDRVFVAGFSIGAVMTDKVACQLADRVAAAVVVAGAPWVGADCAPKQPVSMLIIHEPTIRLSRIPAPWPWRRSGAASITAGAWRPRRPSVRTR
jgi:polyhydroxybutyrate depolymerase